jgi:thiol-disulfide isomerase/thioredoxin
MKHKLLLLFFLLPLLLAAQTVKFENSLKSAFDKAKKQDKIVFVEYYNSECPVCMTLEPMFSDTALARFYNANFISYRLNLLDEKEADKQFMEKTNLHFDGVPFFIFFDKDQNFLHQADVKADVQFLIGVSKEALNPDERDASLEGKYKNGDRTLKTLYAYSLLTQLYKNDTLINQLADDLFAAFPTKDLGNKKSYIITKNCVFTIENGFFKFWIKNMDKLVGLESEKHKGEEKQRIADIVYKSIYSKERKNWDLEKIQEVKTYVLLTGLSQNPDVYFWEQESKLLLDKEHYTEALALGKKILDEEKTGVKSSIYTLLYFIKMLSTTNELNTIKTWIDEISVRKEDKKDEADLMYLNLFYYTKTGNKEMAKQTMDTAIKFYNENNFDTRVLTDLL